MRVFLYKEWWWYIVAFVSTSSAAAAAVLHTRAIPYLKTAIHKKVILIDFRLNWFIFVRRQTTSRDVCNKCIKMSRPRKKLRHHLQPNSFWCVQLPILGPGAARCYHCSSTVHTRNIRAKKDTLYFYCCCCCFVVNLRVVCLHLACPWPPLVRDSVHCRFAKLD